ncbi:transmembrane reductase CYB561D2 [Colletes latitarsis]|uniref:transmembrane reductase CYB561D2 n=1 Tax=Colletes latitarsis TaxID=2605962 RepID=UPI004035D648
MEDLQSYVLRNIKVQDASCSTFENSTDSDNSHTKRSLYCLCVNVIDVINHILVIYMTVFLLIYTAGSFSVMDLHVSLCTVGYVLLMSEAIVILAGESFLTKFLTRRAKSHVHWILQLVGLICIIVGVAVMYNVKKFHFRTTHAILGISSLAIMIFVTIFGYPVFVAAKLRNYIRPVTIKFGHNFLGIASFVIGMTSQCYGYRYNWLANVSHVPHVQLMSIIVTSLITVFSLRGALVSLYRQTECFR